MKNFVCQILLVSFFLSAILLFPVHGQTVTGTLVGHVEDTTGAVIAGARVVITETGRGTSREVTTNEEGNYTFNSLDPGTYRIEIEQANFKKFLQDNVQVAINSTVRVDGNLEAGAVSETVVIESEQVQLKTDRADVSTQITNEQVEEIAAQYRPQLSEHFGSFARCYRSRRYRAQTSAIRTVRSSAA